MISPSLQTAERAAYELKFSLTHELLPRIAEWAARHLVPDSHADARAEYSVRTLYFDTDGLAMYHREAGYRTTKYRVRTYGLDELRYFERKRKRGERVRKIRDAGGVPPPWFETERCKRGLHPVLWVNYRRTAFMSDRMRLTMDQDLTAWRFGSEDTQTKAVANDGPLVLELKFADALPTAFRQLIMDHRLVPTTFSKYRWSMRQLLEADCPTS